MKKRILTLLLAAILLSGTACTQKTETDTAGSGTEPRTDTTTEAAETLPAWALPDTNWDGETVTFLLRDTGGDWCADDVLAEETNGTPINDAVYKRNVTVEDRYNAKIAGNYAPRDVSVAGPAMASIQAGDEAFDIMASWRVDAVNLLQEHALVDLHTSEYLHFDQPWWNAYFCESASIGGKLYYALGDISRVYKLGVRCMFFNKDIAADLGLPNLYDMVREGKWTLDEMFSMAEQGSLDLDGDGEMTKEDRYGLQAQSSLGSVLAFAAGVQIIGKDADDLPTIVVDSERNIEVMEKIAAWISSQKKQNLYVSDNWSKTQERFASNQVLFQAEVMLLIEALRASEVNIGILPPPKADESQSDYISFLDSNCQIDYAIPTTCTRVPFVSFMLEAMAQESTTTLTPAFYDICLSGKYVRDEESTEMLDIIFAHPCIDDSDCYGWGSIYGKLQSALMNGKPIVSTIESVKAATQTGIEKTITKILED